MTTRARFRAQPDAPMRNQRVLNRSFGSVAHLLNPVVNKASIETVQMVIPELHGARLRPVETRSEQSIEKLKIFKTYAPAAVATAFHGDCMELLRSLPDKSASFIVRARNTPVFDPAKAGKSLTTAPWIVSP